MASACSGPRCRAHASASTSQPARAPGLPRLAARRARAPPPPRITNTQREIWDANDEMRDAEGVADADRLRVAPVKKLPVWNPELGPLHERVQAAPEEEKGVDEISVVDTAYWFHTPPKGWPREKRMPLAEELEGAFPAPVHAGDDLEWRFPFGEMEEGWELDGVVSDAWLHHGAQVDFMGEIDGLIPITQEQWRDVGEDLLPGTVVRVRVHKLRDPQLFRWPVQLELLDERLAPLITEPGEYSCPADVGSLFDKGMTLEEVAETLGRTYTPTSYSVEPDMATIASRTQYSFGWMEPEINGSGEGAMERVLSDPANQAAIHEAAAALD